MLQKIKIGAVLFEGYELLDFYGPLQMFGLLQEHFEIHQVAMEKGPVRSSAGILGSYIVTLYTFSIYSSAFVRLAISAAYLPEFLEVSE